MFELASLLLLLQSMLLEIEEKVLALSELSVQSENLMLEGRMETREEAERLAVKLRTLKGGLLDLQKMLQDKQIKVQVRLYTNICACGAMHTPLLTTLHDAGFSRTSQ